MATIWVAGLHDLAEQVGNGTISTEPSGIILPPVDPKKAGNIISWKRWRIPTAKLTPARVVDFYHDFYR